VDDAIRKDDFEKKIAYLTRAAGTSLQGRVSFPNNLRRPLYDFLNNAKLHDLLESLLGPEEQGSRHPSQGQSQSGRAGLPGRLACQAW
jgi:hypothetical protein